MNSIVFAVRIVTSGMSHINLHMNDQIWAGANIFHVISMIQVVNK